MSSSATTTASSVPSMYNSDQRLLHSGFAAINENLFHDQEVYAEIISQPNTNNNDATAINNNQIQNFEPSMDHDYKDLSFAASSNAIYKPEQDYELDYTSRNNSQLDSNLSYYNHHMLPSQHQQPHLHYHHPLQHLMAPQRLHEMTALSSRLPHNHHHHQHHPHHQHHQHHHNRHHHNNMSSDETLGVADQQLSYQHSNRHHQETHVGSRNEASTSASQLLLDNQMEETEGQANGNSLLMTNR